MTPALEARIVERFINGFIKAYQQTSVSLNREQAVGVALRSSGLLDVVEAAKSAEKALKPIHAAVFNDNGSMTISSPMFKYDECVAGYAAYRRLASALAKLGG